MSEMDLQDQSGDAVPEGETELDLEAPEADAAEQRASVHPDGDDDRDFTRAQQPFDVEANPADYAEQSQPVVSDEDDYR